MPARRGPKPARGAGRGPARGPAWRGSSAFPLAALLTWLVVAGSAPAAANADGALPGFTGGFGEPTCRSCHFDAPEEPEEGALVLEGVPEAYRPGETYPLTVVLRHPELARGGFQLTARFAAGAAEGRQAGVLRVPDGASEAEAEGSGGPAAGAATGGQVGAGSSRKAEGTTGSGGATREPAADPRRVEVVPYGDPPVLYARHTVEGAAPVPSHEVRWTVEWQAPEEAGETVDFHAAANAANHDESEFGDVVFTATARSEPGDGSR
ncbi:MAG: choice-of-anchor V domain-containing protein [Thermoanaerobaculia bacterium]